MKTSEEQYWKDYYDSLPPYNGGHIPSPPKVSADIYQKVVIPGLIKFGAIPKKDLIPGKTYIGECRNADEAVWNGSVFIYQRYKFGDVFPEEINHFEDDDGYDLFVPVKLKEDENNIS